MNDKLTYPGPNVYEQIKAFLTEQNTYEPTDDTMIKELVYNIELAQICKADIETEGVTVLVTSAGGETTKVNPTFQVYNAALKNIKEMSTKLGLSPQDRSKMKIIKEDDGPGSAKQMELFANENN